MISRFKFAAAGVSLALAALFVFSINARAAGVFDKTFGSTGTVGTIVGNSAQANAVVLYPDNKILVVGNVTRDNTGQDIFLLRLLANGLPDQSFGLNGRLIRAFSDEFESANAVALQTDGKILIAGSLRSSPNSTDFFVARLMPEGLLDPSFGNNGVYSLNQGVIDGFNALTIQQDGKILAAGKTSDNGLAAVIRLTPAGVFDLEFGDGGFNFFDVPAMVDEEIKAIALRTNGRILVGGRGRTTDASGVFPNFLAEFNSDGSLAADFGNQGFRIFSLGLASANFDFDLTVLPDGRIITISDQVSLFSMNGTQNGSLYPAGAAIARRSDGKVAVTGSSETAVLTNSGRRIGTAQNLSGLNGRDVAVQADDKIVIISSSGEQVFVTRLIAVTSQGTRIADFDSDEKTDFAFLRPSNSVISVLNSTQGAQNYATGEAGFEIQRVIPETYNSPFISPFAYWKAGSAANSPATFCGINSANTRQCFQWGFNTDLPVGGDYNFDYSSDIAVFRPSNGVWYIYQSFSNQFLAVNWGLSGDKPVPADYDYDGATDIAVYRPAEGVWYVRRSSDGNLTAARFGNSTDIPVTGDFDGDGRADFVVYRPSEGIWYLLQSRDGFRAVNFGLANDFPAPGDYDGDGRHDIAVYRGGVWYILGSERGFYSVNWGLANDVPITVRYN